MKTLTLICALKVISNNFNVKKQKRKKDGSEKTEVNVCPHCLLSLLNSWWGKKLNKKKKCTRLAFGALGTNRRYRCIRPPPPTVYAPQHVQTVHYSLLLTGCSWGEGAGSWSFSHPSVPSHRASWLRQPSLGETAKTFPSDAECWGGLWCSFEQSIPKTSSVELPFSHGQSLTTQERSVGDRLRMNSVYLVAAFTINSLSF